MDVFELLRLGKSRHASDLYLVVGSPAVFLINGSLEPADSVGPLTAENINEAFLQLDVLRREKQFPTVYLD